MKMSLSRTMFLPCITLFAVHLNGIIAVALVGSEGYTFIGKPYTFTCLLSDISSLAVTFKATKNHEYLVMRTTQVTGNSCTQCAPDTCSCVVNSEGKGVQFDLTILPISSMDLSTWTCEVFGFFEKSNEVTLRFWVPFTKVEITPVGDLVANISSSVHTACTSSPASRPQAEISWTLRKTDGKVIDITGSSAQVTDPDDNDLNTVKTTHSTLIYTPTDKSYNGASVYCQATNNWTSTQTSQERGLVVHYAPEGSIVMTNNITGQLTEGMSVRFTCQASGGNPLASLSWTCKGQLMTSVNISAGIIARWELQIVVDRSYDGGSCVCTGTHPLWTDSSSITLSVDYPPQGSQGLTITPQKPYYLVNDSVTLTCKSPSSSKPAATFTWSCESRDVTSSATNGNIGNIAASSLMIKLDSRYNGHSCICTVSHPVNNYRQSANITFDVHYTPTASLVMISTPDEKYKGDDVQVVCAIKGGNPLSVVTLSCGVTQGVDNSSTDTSYRFIDLRNIDKDRNSQTCVCRATHGDYAAFRPKKELTLVVYYPPETPTITPVTQTFPWLEEQTEQLSCTAVPGNPAAVGYKWTGSRISAGEGNGQTVNIGRLSYTDDKTKYKCQASNKFTVDKGVTVSGAITLDVQYKPRIMLSRNQAAIRETETFTQYCNATGNPRPSLQWCRGSTLQCYDENNPAILLFEKTLRSDADDYVCKAWSNSDKYGKQESSSTFTLAVNYAPNVNVTATNIPVEGTTNFSMSCSVQGIPPTYTFHKWQHHYDGVLIRELNDKPEYKFLHPLSFEDSGTYTCIVDNGVTGGNGVLLQNNTFHVMVQFRPRFVTESTTQLSGDYKEPLSFNVKFISFPKTTYFMWSREVGNVRKSATNITYEYPVVTTFYGKPVIVKNFGYQSWLNFSNFLTTDVGVYSITVANKIGSANYRFRTSMNGHPNMPTSLQFLSITMRSVIVNWISGENNGFPQTFHLIYQHNGYKITQDVPEIKKRKDYEVVISSLQPQTRYTFELTVSNERGYNPSVLIGNITTLQDNNDLATSSTAPNTASVLLFILSALLFSASLMGFGIRYIVKRRKLQNKTSVREDNKGNINKHTYDTLGDQNLFPDSHYQDIGTPGSDNVKDTDTRNMYSELGQRDIPNVYEKIKPKKNAKFKQAHLYENTSFNEVV